MSDFKEESSIWDTLFHTDRKSAYTRGLDTEIERGSGDVGAMLGGIAGLPFGELGWEYGGKFGGAVMENIGGLAEDIFCEPEKKPVSPYSGGLNTSYHSRSYQELLERQNRG